MKTVILLGCATVMLAQTPGSSDEPIVFRSTTRLVQVSLVVQDGSHRPVPGLTASDFAVLESGKPQKISFFSVDQAGVTRAASGKGMPPNVFSNRSDGRTGTPTTVTAIVVDLLNTSWKDQYYARTSVLRFLSQIRPEDRVALYTLGRGLTVLHDYTSDASALIARMKRFQGQELPEFANSTPDPELLGFLRDSGISGQGEIIRANFTARNRILNTLRSLEAIAAHLSAIPGRKNLVWVSGSFPLMISGRDIRDRYAPVTRVFDIDQKTFLHEFQKTTRALNHANVSVYPIDARGLVAQPAGADRRGGIPTQTTYTADVETMTMLAGDTGGRAFVHRNDLDGALREVFAESALTYTLGYYSDALTAEGKWREIEVKVNRPGLQLRYRKGYMAMPELRLDDESTIKADLRTAVWSPLDSATIGINARIDAMPGTKTLRARLQIDPSAVTLTEVGDRRRGRIDVALVVKAEDGRHLDAYSEDIGMNLKAETYREVLENGILYERTFPSRVGAASIKIVVRDAASGLTGSLTIPAQQGW